MTSVEEDPKRLVEMYARLLEERSEIALAPTADYPDFLERYSYPPVSTAFYWIAQGEISAIANRVNAFWYSLLSVGRLRRSGWHDIISG